MTNERNTVNSSLYSAVFEKLVPTRTSRHFTLKPYFMASLEKRGGGKDAECGLVCRMANTGWGLWTGRCVTVTCPRVSLMLGG